MAKRLLTALAAALALVTAAGTNATERDRHQRALFMKKHPCPGNGHTSGRCPGYIVDHIKPLCAGGADRPGNMQWQTVQEAKVKDRQERKMCAKEKRI